jgi:hypothetical protein
MKVYRLIFSLIFKPWNAEVYVVYRGETRPIAKPYVSKSGKLVIMKQGPEFLSDPEDMPPVRSNPMGSL